MLELYHAHISTCSQKVRLCLAEKGLAWTGHPIDFATGAHLAPSYLKLNPNGVVPTLLDDGRPVIDSSVICEYLEEIAPQKGTSLMPETQYGRAKVRAWLRYIEEVPTVSIRIPSFNGLFLAGWNAMSEQARTRYIAATPLRKGHYRRFGTGGFSKEQMDESLERLRQTVERIDAAAGAESRWLAGERISLADLCVLPTIVRMSDLGIEKVWDGLPHFQDWYGRMKARPSFAQAFYPEARVAPPMRA
ncbi:MAG: glutathione S-transferase family protein [Candidatus Binataceae bacterium]